MDGVKTINMSLKLLLLFATVLGLCCGETLGPELLVNPGFESPDFDGNWYCNGCTLTRSTDSIEGEYSAKITDRAGGTFNTIAQFIKLEPKKRYYFRSFVKFLSNAGDTLLAKTTITFHFTFTDGSEKWLHEIKHHNMRAEDGWERVAGDIIVAEQAFLTVRLYFNQIDPSISFLVDDCSLREIPENLNWRTEAEARIEQIRKSNVKINLQLASKYNPNDITIELNQMTSAFPFGVAIKAINFNVNEKYQNFVESNSEVVTLANKLKWRLMEWNKGVIDYETPRTALDILQRMNMPVRGHCIFWGVEKNTPNWIRDHTAEQVQVEIEKRLDYVVPFTKGRLIQWDVNNENLHGRWFEELLNERNVTIRMFEGAQKRDPDVALFLNEYEVGSRGAFTEQYMQQAIDVKAANVGLKGIGVQSHFKAGFNPDPTILLRRMNTLSKASLPIWITEFSLDISDEDQRALQLENALITYFSHPNVEGLVMWGFWSEESPGTAIANGENFDLNAAGRVWRDYWFGRWRSNLLLRPTSNIQTLLTRAFQGDYVLSVKHHGATIKAMAVAVPKGSSEVDILVVVE